MKKKSLFIIAIIAVVCIFAVDSSAFKGYIFESIESKAADSGIFLRLSEPSLGFGRFSVNKATVLFKALPVSLEVSSVNVKCKPNILAFSLACTANFSAYEGTAEFLVSLGFSGVTVHKGLINSVKVNLHPQLNALGLSQGDFSAELNEISDNIFSSRIGIKGLVKPEQSTLPSWMVKMPFDLPIPSFTVEDLSMTLSSRPASTDISSLILKSNLAEISSKNFVITKTSNHSVELSGDLEVIPSDEGIKFLPLALVCRAEKLAPGKPINLKFNGTSMPMC